MDELVQPFRADGPDDQEPLFPPLPVDELPGDFVALRLILETTGAAIDLTKPEVLIGRHSECDIRLPLPDVSRRHCIFRFDDGQWRVRDLKSLNGVHLNGVPIGAEVTVAPGDQVRIAGFQFRLENANAPSEVVDDVPQTILYRIFRALPLLDNKSRRRNAG